MKKLVVLNHNYGSVDIYDVEDNLKIDEDYLYNLGYREDEISWITGDLEINYNNEILRCV